MYRMLCESCSMKPSCRQKALCNQPVASLSSSETFKGSAAECAEYSACCTSLSTIAKERQISPALKLPK